MNWFKKKQKEEQVPKIKDFPLEIEHWAAGNDGNSGKTCEKTDTCPLFPYWSDEGKYIDHSVGDHVPLFKCGWHTAIYKIVDWNRKGGDDRAGWDDGRTYTLQFVELCRSNVDKRIE